MDWPRKKTSRRQCREVDQYESLEANDGCILQGDAACRCKASDSVRFHRSGKRRAEMQGLYIWRGRLLCSDHTRNPVFDTGSRFDMSYTGLPECRQREFHLAIVAPCDAPSHCEIPSRNSRGSLTPRVLSRPMLEELLEMSTQSPCAGLFFNGRVCRRTSPSPIPRGASGSRSRGVARSSQPGWKDQQGLPTSPPYREI